MKINPTYSPPVVPASKPLKQPEFQVSNILAEAVKGFTDKWRKLELKSQKNYTHLPKEIRGFVEIQNDFQKINLQTQVASQVAEAFNSTVKKIQQMS